MENEDQKFKYLSKKLRQMKNETSDVIHLYKELNSQFVWELHLQHLDEDKQCNQWLAEYLKGCKETLHNLESQEKHLVNMVNDLPLRVTDCILSELPVSPQRQAPDGT